MFIYYVLNRIIYYVQNRIINSDHVGLYRDDGLMYIPNSNGPNTSSIPLVIIWLKVLYVQLVLIIKECFLKTLRLYWLRGSSSSL